MMQRSFLAVPESIPELPETLSDTCVSQIVVWPWKLSPTYGADIPLVIELKQD